MSTSPLRLMAVHAHPDDESSKGAATTARYAAQGVEVLVVTCTGGERGSILNPHYGEVVAEPEQMNAIRQVEMRHAAQALGVSHRWLGFIDSGLPEGDPLPPLPPGCFALEPLDVPTRALVEVMREFRPHVVTTYDPSGGYPHPDHIRCHEVSWAAFHAAGDADAFVGTGEPWQPLKLYYNHDFSMNRVSTLHRAMIDAGLESPYGGWVESREAREIPERQATTRVECADFLTTVTRRYVRMLPRLTRRAFSLRFHVRWNVRCGRWRSMSWLCPMYQRPCPKMISSQVSATTERTCHGDCAFVAGRCS